MKVFLFLFLLPLVASAVEKVENIEESTLTKRGVDHRSNIALLNTLNFENIKPADNFNQISSQQSNIVNVGNSGDGTIPVTVNTENLALGNPNPTSNEFQYTYAPSYTSSVPQNLPLVNTAPLESDILYFTGEKSQTSSFPFVNFLNSNLPLIPSSSSNIQNGAVNDIQDNRNILQTYVPQNVVQVPQQQYPIQLIREVKVPQPYPVHITRTIQVPVHIRVPVEVPKPYPVHVPHPVPVPVHVKVPVPVEKPYPVQITKTIAVPVEKPVYIKVPQPIQVPVAQPYPVGVPQPVQVQVPFLVRFSDIPEPSVATGSNLESSSAPLTHNQQGPFIPELIPSRLSGTPVLPELNPINGQIPVNPLEAATECSSCKDKITDTTTLSTSPKPSLPPITGNGLLPPQPPPKTNPKPTEGLLNSYVSSKDGGVYRRGTEYQTNEYKKTW